MPSLRETPSSRRGYIGLVTILVIAGCFTAWSAVAFFLSMLAIAPTGESGTPASVKRMLIPIGGLIVLALIGGVAVLLARRSMLAKDAATADQGGLLDDLRKMRDTGQISPEEFDAARKSIAAKLKGEAQPAAVRPPARSPIPRDNHTRPIPKTPN